MASTDNTLPDLHNSSYDTKAEFNNRFIIQEEEGEPSRGLRVLLFSPLYIVRIYK